MFVKVDRVFLDIITVQMLEMLQILRRIFHFVLGEFVEVQRLQVGAGVEDELEPEVVRVAVEFDLFNAGVDRQVEKVGINCKCRIFGEHIYRHFFDGRAQPIPCLENCLQVFAVNYHMLFTDTQVTPTFLIFITHDELLHDDSLTGLLLGMLEARMFSGKSLYYAFSDCFSFTNIHSVISTVNIARRLLSQAALIRRLFFQKVTINREKKSCDDVQGASSNR